jgi:prolyl oligopeptidase
VRSFTLSGKPVASVGLPPVSAVSHLAPAGRDLVFGVASYVAPFRWVRLDRRSGTLTELAAISPKPPVDLSGWEVHREFATSKDGTRVPYNVVWQKGAPLDGSVPCVATGYGGFGFSQEPAFLETMSLETTAPLLRRGLCFVTANLRGGSELGEEWHRAGALTHKQNVFDDFAAVLGDLAARRYTSPDRLAIIGSSNGGLLMGAIITQHPELVRAVVSRVGIYDMLRVELSSNGSYNIPEFGTVTDEAQFTAMYAYSPYHHVTPRKYPAVLFTTGTNDPRVAPWHSRKMIAALQAAQRGAAPILLRTSETAGHGIGTGMSEQIDDDAHADAFLLSQIRGTAAAH